MEKRYFNIDILRFFAAFGVMTMHYLIRGFPNDTYSSVSFGDIALVTKYNYLAVNLFFMISGFVILMSAQHSSPKRFIQSRFLRLYPAFWFCCTVSFLLTVIFINHIFHLTLSRYLANMTMLNGFFNIGYVDNVYWTLLVEMKFYIFIFLLLITRQIKNIENFAFLWLFVAALQIYYSNPLVETLFVTNYASFFIAGCLFYISASNGYTLKRIIGILVTIPIGFYYEYQHLAHRHVQYSIEYSAATLFCILIGIYLLIYFATIKTECSETAKMISKKLGQTSYPLYLIHLNLGIVVLNVFGSKVDKWLLFGLLVISVPIFAYLISEFVESPLRKFLNLTIFKSNRRGNLNK